MNVRRVVQLMAATMVASIAAIASYGHIREVALMAGQSELIALVLPLSVDGLVAVGSIGLASGSGSKLWAWLAFASGVLASLAANVIAAEPTTLARVVSAWPAIALLITGEVLVRPGKPMVNVAVAEETLAKPPSLAVTFPDVPAIILPEPLSVATPSVANSDVAKPAKAKAGGKPRRNRRSAEEATRAVASLLAKNPKMGNSEIAVELGMSSRSARRYRTAAAGMMSV